MLRLLLAFMLAVSALPATAQSLADLARTYPDSAALQRRLLASALEEGDSAAAHAAMERLATLGFALSEATQERLQSLIGSGQGARFRPRFAANGESIVASNVVATIPASVPLIEGVAWDGKTMRLFATSVVGRKLIYRTDKGWREVEGLAAGSLSGIAVDSHRRLLWLASGATERTPEAETAYNGLIALDLDTLKVKHRVPMPGKGWIGDIAIGPEGTVYAADPLHGTIYRVPAWLNKMLVLVPPGRLLSPQGMVAPDRERLYVADYVYGPVAVSLKDGSFRPLASDAGTMLDGIDGLLPWRGGLVAIQNGTNPMRIVYLALDPAGDGITRAEVLEAANPKWGEPTLGAIRDGELIYVDGQGPRYGDGGKPVGEGPVPDTAIRALSLARAGPERR